MKYMARQPNQSPTKPEMTREARMPVSRPDMTMPTLRLLCSGRENCEAMGTKICGMTEQAPVMSEAAQMTGRFEAMPMANREKISNTKLVRMIVRRRHRSPSGTMKSSPRA